MSRFSKHPAFRWLGRNQAYFHGSVLLVVLILLAVKDQYPFSHFPMYSNFGKEADIVFVTDQDGQPLSMREVFKVGASNAKKRYKSDLKKVCKERGVDIEDASLEDRKLAAKKSLEDLYEKRPEGELEKLPVTGLGYVLRIVALENGKLTETDELLAQMEVNRP